MSVIMRFQSRKAILCGAQWTAADNALERTLNEATREWLAQSGGPPLGHADPDFATAMTVGVALGGVIHAHQAPRSRASRTAYHQARQMSLF